VKEKIFSHLDEDIFDFDNITFGDDSKGGVKGIDNGCPLHQGFDLCGTRESSSK
jgi:hypothetical protein